MFIKLVIYSLDKDFYTIVNIAEEDILEQERILLISIYILARIEVIHPLLQVALLHGRCEFESYDQRRSCLL